MKITVTPIDMDAPGSFRARNRLIEAMEAIEDAEGKNDVRAIAKAMRAIQALIIPHVRTDEDTPVQEALDKISANDFDKLLMGVMGNMEAIPPVSANSSTDGPKARGQRSRRG